MSIFFGVHMDKVNSIQSIDFNEIFCVHMVKPLDCERGGILTHGVPVVHHWIEEVGAGAGGAGFIVPALLNAAAGIVAGVVVLAGVMAVSKIWKWLKG